MKFEYLKIGLKIILGAAGCLAVVAGVGKLFSPTKQKTVEDSKKTLVDPQTGEAVEVVMSSDGKQRFDPNSGLGEVGGKIYGAAMCAQAAITGLLNIVGALSTVKTSVDRILDKSYYNTMLNDPRVAQGYYGNPMIPSGCYGGYPNGTPMCGDGVTYIRRGQVIECY